MLEHRVSEAVIRRMPRYYRQLIVLQSQGVERISSSALADQMRLNASQVRQDFNCFGGFGQQGYGYNVSYLLEEIRSILAVDHSYTMVIVGAGHIGHALAAFEGFERDGITVRALFDVDEALVGTECAGKPVLHVDDMEEYIKNNCIDVGVIAARRSAAQALADCMVRAGVKGIWNFAPTDVIADVPVENVHLSDGMICLLYKMDKADSPQ